MEDLSTCVDRDDLLLALQNEHGSKVKIQSFRAERATSSVQGFMSLMLRIIAKIVLCGKEVETKMILKRMPIQQEHIDIVNKNGVFDHETSFYKNVLPILQANSLGKLPFANCYLVRRDAIFMDDLNSLGYKTLTSSFQEIAKEGIMQVSHAILVCRKLAQLHAASLDQDWQSIVPKEIGTDVLFQGTFKHMVSHACETLKMAIEELYSDKDCTRYLNFLNGDHFFNAMEKLGKPVKGALNVLNHGDCWLSNMMFKIDKETKKPRDLKFLDMQCFRYTSASRDLIYFLYTCASRAFRDLHEQEILRAYVEAFNSSACQTPDLLSLEDFTKDYENARMFGLPIAAVLRLRFFMDIVPEESDKLSQDQFDSYFKGLNTEETRIFFRKNASFRSAVKDIVDELMQLLDKLQWKDFNAYVSREEISQAVHAQFGECVLENYDLEPYGNAVTGYTSKIIRVVAKINKCGEIFHTNLIVKALPELQQQIQFVQELNLFEREASYFREIVPVLKDHSSEKLPLVETFYVSNDKMIMEDLCSLGYVTLASPEQALASDTFLTLAHVRLVARKLALIHAPSLNVVINHTLSNYMKNDVMFNEKFRGFLSQGCKCLIVAMQEFYSPERCSKYTDWLQGDNVFETMERLAKPVKGDINVINQGDCWLNNMMFKADPATSKPIDVKILDLQVFRNTSPSRDLLYFIYTSTSRAFRKEHELEILRTYVEAFNTAACRTPNLLTLEDFTKTYDRARMFGLGIGIAVRRVIFSNIIPYNVESLTEDMFESMFSKDISSSTKKMLTENLKYKQEMLDLAEEFMEVFDNSIRL